MSSRILFRCGLGAAGVLLALGSLRALPMPTPPTPQQEKATWNKPVREWSEGPVRYALTSSEQREFRSLKTAAELAGFIARFWASRDPDPYTPGNPAEEAFWKRVSAADELFATTTLSGWRTDRGRIYIILGPPDEISSYAVPSVSELDPTHWHDGIKRGPQQDLPLGQRGAVEWVYRSLPNPEAVAGQTITFVKNHAGEFEMSQSLNATFRYEAPRTDRGVPPGAKPSPPPARVANLFDGRMRSMENLATWAQGALFEKMDPTLASADGRVSASEFFGMFPVRHGIAFFRGEGGTAALLAVGVPAEIAQVSAADPPELEIFGSLEKLGDTPQAYQFSSKRTVSDRWPVQTLQGEKQILFEVRGVIPPGTYRMSFGARSGDRAGTSVVTLDAPDFSGTSLSLGGPVLADDLGPVLEGDATGPFSLGQIRVVPKLGADYVVGSDFGFYFQVYEARPKPEDGRPHLDIYYSVAARSEGIYQPLGKPVTIEDNSAPTHAYRLPLKGWPPGEYLLTVTVKDRISGEVASGTAGFRVLPAPP